MNKYNLNDDPKNALEAHNKNCQGTLLSRGSPSVPANTGCAKRKDSCIWGHVQYRTEYRVDAGITPLEQVTALQFFFDIKYKTFTYLRRVNLKNVIGLH